MAGTVTVSEESITSTAVGLRKIAWDWLSAVGGAADLVTTLAYTGELKRFVTIPDGGGTQPSDNYDITITDGDGVDVLAGAGANRDNVATEQVLAASLGCVANDTLTLNVTNAGDAKGGIVYLYIG